MKTDDLYVSMTTWQMYTVHSCIFIEKMPPRSLHWIYWSFVFSYWEFLLPFQDFSSLVYSKMPVSFLCPERLLPVLNLFPFDSFIFFASTCQLSDLSSLYFFKASLKVSKSFIPTRLFSLLFPRSFCLSIIWIPSFLLSSLLVLGSFYLSIIWILSLLLSSLFVLKRFCPSQIWNLPFLLSSLLVLRRFCPSQIW